MPYIDKEDQAKYDANKLEHCGILNYAINQLVNEYIEQNGKCYQTFNDVTGALENAKLKFIVEWLLHTKMKKLLKMEMCFLILNTMISRQRSIDDVL